MWPQVLADPAHAVTEDGADQERPAVVVQAQWELPDAPGARLSSELRASLRSPSLCQTTQGNGATGNFSTLASVHHERTENLPEFSRTARKPRRSARTTDPSR
jgi:hypothetical protein